VTTVPEGDQAAVRSAMPDQPLAQQPVSRRPGGTRDRWRAVQWSLGMSAIVIPAWSMRTIHDEEPVATALCGDAVHHRAAGSRTLRRVSVAARVVHRTLAVARTAAKAVTTQGGGAAQR
jgi:hypothetical protein